MAVFEHDLQVILPRLTGPLRVILDRELAAGNTIHEIAAPWPMKRCNVWLAERFKADYAPEFPTLAYRWLGDPKNWIEEYVDAERGCMVAVSGSAGLPSSSDQAGFS